VIFSRLWGFQAEGLAVAPEEAGAGRMTGPALERIVHRMRERTDATTSASPAMSSTDQRRVIVRFANGRTLRGYCTADAHQAAGNNLPERISIRNSSGNVEEVELAGLKAIFFVKTFEGSKDYSEFKVFTHQPSGRGVWVRVHFHDGEVMEGVAPNSLSTFSGTVFSLTPPDPQSNNEIVIVAKSCLKEMQILGLASD
jgi:hypothetical protein